MRKCLQIAPFVLAGLLAAVPALAQRLPPGVTPEHYDLSFDVHLARASFDGTAVIRVRLAEASRRIVLHALELQLHEATIRSGSATQTAAVALDHSAQTAALTVPRRMPAGTAEIRIRFTGRLNDDLRGFYLSKANGRSYAVTQLESTDARRAFPSFDEPSLKATFALTLIVDRGDTAISNGALLSDTPGPGPNRHTLTFATSPRMSSYLVAMAVGDFACVEGAAATIPIRVCATPDKKALTALALDMTGQIVGFYNSYFSIPYPFAKLDMVAIPDFAAGAMENTAAIFYRETDLLADAASASLTVRKRIATVISHEVAHQWFGNLVTMRWWDDLWLNEGFATWIESRPLAERYPEWHIEVDEVLGNQTALNLDALRSTRPIHSNAETPAEIEETFDLIAYEKGAAVMRMVERYVGAEDFRKGINAYLARHSYANATSEDFWNAVARASGKPVDRILPTFVNQPGVPLVDVSLSCTGNAGRISLTQERFALGASAARTPARWQIPICRKTSDATAPTCIELGTTSAELRETSCPAWVFVNAGAHGYFRTAYPAAMLRAIAPDVQARLTAPERLSLVGDEWSLVSAGRHTAADYLTLAAGFGAEPISGVLEEVTERLAFMHAYLTTAATRPRFEAFIRSLLRPRFNEIGLTGRDDGDDRQALRVVLLDALGTTGNDPDVIAQARALTDRALAGGPPLHPSIESTAMRVAARRGNAALFDALVHAATRADSPDKYYGLVGALAYFEEPSLVDRGLARLLTDEVRSQDAAQYLRGFLANPNGGVNARAWAFLKANWAKLQPKLSISLADARVIAELSSFCDAGTRHDITAFFAANRRPAAARTLQQTLERIDNCIAIREKQTPSLDQWIARGAAL